MEGVTAGEVCGSAVDRLLAIRRSVVDACLKASRDPNSVTLVAASKGAPMPILRAVVEAGHRVFGENRVQEAEAKWPTYRARCPDIQVHPIGHLQSNKVRDAVSLFDVIHSVDRLSLCDAVARVGGQHKTLLFLQVNTGKEEQKTGVFPEEADDFLVESSERFGVKIAGLTCIPPVHEDPTKHFKLLADIAARNRLRFLSMGMSADFELAIKFGATHVRVGTAIFGQRIPSLQSG